MSDQGDRSPEPAIDGAALKAALEGILQALGEAGRRYVMADLEENGIRFDACSRYTLEQARSALAIIGPDAADLVIERLRRQAGLRR